MKKILVFIFLIFCFSNTVKSQCIDSSLINPFCICPMIYAPVCACNGLVYSNSCLAQCDGNTIIGPVDPTLVPGQPCSLSACDVNIIGDSIACNYPVILEASSASLVSPFIYSWWDNSGSILSTGNLLTVSAAGIYYVSVTDANGCTDTTSINMQHMSMTIYSIPNPPNICLGDSIYLVHDTSFVNTIWLNSPQSSNPATFYPNQDITYIAEAVDANGCQLRGEIFVDVDSCVSNIVDLSKVFNIYPNPTDNYLNLQNNTNHYYSFYIYDIAGKLIKEKNNLRNLHAVNLSYLNSGVYFLNIHSGNNNFFKKIIIE